MWSTYISRLVAMLLQVRVLNPHHKCRLTQTRLRRRASDRVLPYLEAPSFQVGTGAPKPTYMYVGQLRIVAVAGILLALNLSVLPASSQSQSYADRSGGAYQQMEVELAVDHAPAPGGVATFTFRVKPLRYAPDLTIIWELPDGGVLQGGPAVTILGEVAVGEFIEQQRQVHFLDAGIYTVQVRATYHPDRATTLNAVGVLFFTISDEGSSVSDLDPRMPRYEPPRNKPTVDKSGSVVAASTWGATVPQGCFSVTGFLTREERQPAANPPRFVDALGSAVPVHHTLVEMREEDTFSDDSYGHTVTNANGRFQFDFCDDDGVGNDELELYIRVCSEVWDGPNQIARITDATEVELYCFDSGTIDSEGGAVDFDVTVYQLSQIQSQIFNIADSLYWAWKYWNDNLGQGAPAMNRSVNVRWQAGKRVTGSFYNEQFTTIVIADDPSSNDEWDDSVIIHEWGHFADHQLSCNRNPGGPHTLPGMNNMAGGDRLSWGEGYPDFYQSAARTIMPGSGFTSFYIDVNGPTVDFEVLPGTASVLNEGAVAAMLWDFIDAVNDGSDTVNHGHARVQKIYTDPAFQGNAQCNTTRFIRVWKDLGFPTDAQTAATIVQNVNVTNPFALAAAEAELQGSSQAEPLLTVANQQSTGAATAAVPHDYRWWDQVTMVIDNSTSMAGPPATPKINAVKALIKEQVNDLSANPLGTEFNLYAFNAGSPTIATLTEGRFFAEQINPVLDGLAAAGGDAGCPVLALDALTQAVQGKYDGQAWVYTDGDAAPSTSVAYVQQQLNDQMINGSVVLLGGCSTLPTVQSNVTGAEKNYLGLAADGTQPGGIVPYLLTAIGTGGSFLFVGPDQLANAVDILRAQSSHSAGAGRWSDYVSDHYTYRWDRLETWEYNWIPSSAFGVGTALPPDSPVVVDLPAEFSFYGGTTDQVEVFEDGYIWMNPCHDIPQFPVCLFGFEQYVENLHKDLEWDYDVNPNLAAAQQSPNAPAAGPLVRVYHGGLIENQWYVLSTEGTADYGGGATDRRAYQVWLNLQTGEIRYLYDQLRSEDTAGAVIGVRENALFGTPLEVVISNQDLGGAANGTGYKLTPAPPQPSKSYTVTVDGHIQSIGFLQTGYSGTFDPMQVFYPDGTVVDCNDTANVLCLNLNNGLLQYVQVNVNDRTGVYTAVIGAGSSGEGTFSFNALAATPIQPTGLGKRTLSLGEQVFKVDLGRSADGGVLSGWLQTATGTRLGSGFMLYDDGAHDDGLSGDGIFASDGFTPPGQSVAYLWTQGMADGVAFTRSDPAPYNFQPIQVAPEVPYAQGFLGSPAAALFLVTNQDSIQRCYHMEVAVPAGWSVTSTSGTPFCVGPGATNGPYAFVSHPLDDRSGGVAGEVEATFTEVVEGRISGGDKVAMALFRPLESVEFDNRWIGSYLRPNGSDTVSMTVNLLDDQGSVSGWSGALGFELTTTLGQVSAPTGVFEQGRMSIVFTAGNEAGEALLTFVLEGGVTTTTTLQIRQPTATSLDLVANPKNLVNEGTSALRVSLLDIWGDPVVGQQVRISVSDDDGNQGSINGSEVFTGTTNANGRINVTFTKSDGAVGQVYVRAEALVGQNGALRVSQEDVELLILSDNMLPNEADIHIPMIRK